MRNFLLQQQCITGGYTANALQVDNVIILSYTINMHTYLQCALNKAKSNYSFKMTYPQCYRQLTIVTLP